MLPSPNSVKYKGAVIVSPDHKAVVEGLHAPRVASLRVDRIPQARTDLRDVAPHQPKAAFWSGRRLGGGVLVHAGIVRTALHKRGVREYAPGAIAKQDQCLGVIDGLAPEHLAALEILFDDQSTGGVATGAADFILDLGPYGPKHAGDRRAAGGGA